MAARLSERGDRRVVLVEAGPARSGPRLAAELDPDRLPAAHDPRVLATSVELGTGSVQAQFLRGRGIGGSSSVNGAYFVRPPRADAERWAAQGFDRWSWDALLPTFRRLEADVDLGPSSLHGADGPMPVRRHGDELHQVTRSFFEACADAGHPEHADLNDGGSEGWGLVPRNVDARGRVDVASAYLGQVVDRDNLEIRSELAAEVVVEGGRLLGVRPWSAAGPGELLRAASVVSCAGALASPRLVDDGLGRPDARRQVALHPAIELDFEPVDGVELDESPLLQGALHQPLPSGGVVELLVTCRPYGRSTGAEPDDRTLSIRVSLMTARSRAAMHRGSGGGWLEQRWTHWHPQDRDDLRWSVRLAAGLARSAPFAGVVERWHGPPSAALRDDATLDRWIATRLTLSMHAAGSAPMRRRGRRGTVDQLGRVRGLEGLRIVDTSILPDLPSRGPAYMAVAIAEHLAPTFD